MLQQLTILNFAVVSSLTLDWQQGMTTITGETGAGKSIALDALSLCLGARAEASMVRPGASKTDISACFNISNLPMAQVWLDENDLDSDDGECILRRTITKEGRSRGYINGQPVPLQQLKSIGSYLINIHGQHAHLDLLKPERQQLLLDEYAEHDDLLNSVAHRYQSWQKLSKNLNALQADQDNQRDRIQLLSYQVQELDEFALQEGEFEELEANFKRLSHAEDLLRNGQQSHQLLAIAEPVNVSSMLHQITQQLNQCVELDASLEPTLNLLEEAKIQLDEASAELEQFCEAIEFDPEGLAQTEKRMQQALDLSRKHHVAPERLPALHQKLTEELAGLANPEQALDELKAQVEQAEQDYIELAATLTESRQKAGETLAKGIIKEVQRMNMPHTKVSFDLAPTTPSKTGSDEIRLLVATNPGQPLGELGKVASGGELSRLGLAIQVLTHHNQATPTLVFDEVDVGISGQTASVVGKMLRSLGQKSQVICVTHLPQVAASGHQQLFVDKLMDQDQTQTRVQTLDKQGRIRELARLLGGEQITEHTLANAQELLFEA